MKEQITKISKKVKENEAFIIKSEANCFYLSAFDCSNRIVVVTSEKCYFLTDFRYAEDANNKIKDMIVIESSDFRKSIKEIADKHSIKKLLFERESTTLDSYERFSEFCKDNNLDSSFDSTLDTILFEARAIKTKEEIDLIKEAQSITDKAFSHILTKIEKGKTELEIALELEFFMKQNSDVSLAFETISVSGKNSSLCHGKPSSKKLNNGDFLTLDFGAKYKGYCSDMTRTVVIGKANEEMIDVYNTVLRAQSEAIKQIKVGKACKDIDKIARDIIDKDYKGAFGHSLGHSLGVDIHENPTFSTRCDKVLEENMILTVEPGIYLNSKFGVRIEDMVLITEDGCENLTHSSKELIEI